MLHEARLKSYYDIDNPSSLQMILYSVLDNLNMNYCPEGPKTIVGPIHRRSSNFEGYCFDCLIPATKKYKALFIECQGEYYHGKEREKVDRAKATFLKKYYPEYDLLAIWEHEFRSKNNIARIIKIN